MIAFTRSKALLSLTRRFSTLVRGGEGEVSTVPVYLRPYDATKYEKPSTKLKVGDVDERLRLATPT